MLGRSLVVGGLLTGCMAHPASSRAQPVGPTPIPVDVRLAYNAERFAEHDVKRKGGGEIMLDSPLSASPAIGRSRTSSTFGTVEQAAPTPAPPPPPIPLQPRPAQRAEQFDIEGKVQLNVADIELGRARLAALTEAFGGQVLNESVADEEYSRGASLSLR